MIDHDQFKDANLTQCTISGWGDTNTERRGAQQPALLQTASVFLDDFQVSINHEDMTVALILYNRPVGSRINYLMSHCDIDCTLVHLETV